MATTMSITRKYIDQAGLAKVFALIKANYAGKTNFENIVALVGLAEKAAEGQDSKTLVARLAELETAVGEGGSVATQIKNAIEALDVTEFSSGVASTSGHVTVGLTQTDGKITALTVADSDVASAALLGTKTDAKTAETAFGYIAKEADRATTAENALDARLDVLEGAATVAGSVAKAEADAKAYADSLIAGLDTAAAGVEGNSARVKVNVKETNGIISSVTVTENDIAQASVVTALDNKVGTIPASATATTVVGYAKEVADAAQAEADGRLATVEAAITALNGTTADTSVTKKINDKIATLDATVHGNMSDADAVTAAQKVGVKVVEADGKLTGVTVVTNDIASAALLGTAADTKETTGTAFGKIAKVAADLAQEVTDRGTAITNAVNALDATVGSTTVAEGKHVAVQVVETNGKLTGVTVTENDVASANALSNLVTLVGAGSLTSGNNVLTRVTAAENAINTLNGASTVTGSVDQKVATAIATIVNENNNGSIDTLNEIAAWIISDTTGAAKMASDISTLQTEVETASTGLLARVSVLEAETALTDAEIEAAFNYDPSSQQQA